MPLINNKMKQAVGGNWGKPQNIEQHIKLKSFVVEYERIPGKKKPRKMKRDYIIDSFCCPFCKKELPKDKSIPRNYFFNRVKKCPDCGALGKQECPACKHETWLLKGTYKHQGPGCGFEGEKLKEHSDVSKKKAGCKSTMPVREAWMYENPKIRASIQKGIQEAKEGKGEIVKDVGAFIKKL